MTQAIVLAAGQGKRMQSSTQKVLLPLCGRSLLEHVLASINEAGIRKITVVISPDFDENAIPKGKHINTVIQPSPQGTGDAVRVALTEKSIDGPVIVLCGDTPLLTPATVKSLIEAFHARSHSHLLMAGMIVEGKNHPYGRLVCGADGSVERIVEVKDLEQDEQHITLCNAGLLMGEASLLRSLLLQVTPHNQAQEYYLTDCVALARMQGIPTYVVEGSITELGGINTQAERAQAARILQNRWRSYWMDRGVFLIDPETVYFSYDTQLAADVTVEPCVIFGSGVSVEPGATIRSYCHLEHTHLGKGAIVGPFAHVRGGSKIDAQAVIGNFVEVKNSHFHTGAKAKHLSYIGDATVGHSSNIGAGTITCNYNGFEKASTVIGAHALIGSNTALIAPVSIGERAIVGAGSVVHEDVPADALALARAPQSIKPGWAITFRQRYQQKEK